MLHRFQAGERRRGVVDADRPGRGDGAAGQDQHEEDAAGHQQLPAVSMRPASPLSGSPSHQRRNRIEASGPASSAAQSAISRAATRPVASEQPDQNIHDDGQCDRKHDRPDEAAGHEAHLRALTGSLPDHEHRSPPCVSVSIGISPAGPAWAPPGWCFEQSAVPEPSSMPCRASDRSDRCRRDSRCTDPLIRTWPDRD